MCSCPSGPMPPCSTLTVKMQCEREDSLFILVSPTARFFLPSCQHRVRKKRARERFGRKPRGNTCLEQFVELVYAADLLNFQILISTTETGLK